MSTSTPTPQELADIKRKLENEILRIKSDIESLKVEKAKEQEKLGDLKKRKKKRMDALQNDINKAKLPPQKVAGRNEKRREQQGFDSQIDSVNTTIGRINTRIAEKSSEKADCEKYKKRVNDLLKSLK